ncbi:hypothetical protein [Frankia tisae]|uniref:hypothetical protein n=1 Tax=Frankia tisae TaxID=2950104 RepID=UPI0021BE22A9|nr:hypothetical protein [Frankia tisae]
MADVVNEGARGLGAWHIPRSRGAVSGLLLMLLGIWGALIPFVGPYFDFAFTSNSAWTWTSARFWLEVLPGIAAFAGGLLLLASANRGTAALGAWLAIGAGAWFIIGPTLAAPWHLGSIGAPLGGSARQALEWISFYYGLGAVILFLGSTAWGRLSVRGVRDVAAARRHRERTALRSRGGREETWAPPVSEPQVYPSDRPSSAPAPGAGRPAGVDSAGSDLPAEGRAGAYGRHRRRDTSQDRRA